MYRMVNNGVVREVETEEQKIRLEAFGFLEVQTAEVFENGNDPEGGNASEDGNAPEGEK